MTPVDPPAPAGPPCDFAPTLSQSPFSPFSQPSYRGCTPPPAPTPVRSLLRQSSSRTMTLFAHCSRAVRVAAPVVTGPRAPPPTLAFSPFRDGSNWCSKCLRRTFRTVQGLMKHSTHHHAGSVVDEDTCALFVAIERITCSTPSCGGHRRASARVRNRCNMPSPARPPAVGDNIMGPWARPRLLPSKRPLKISLLPLVPLGRSRRGCQTSFALGGRSFRGSSSTCRRTLVDQPHSPTASLAPIALAAQSAPIARPPQAWFPLCSPWRRKRTCLGPKSSFPRPLRTRRLTVIWRCNPHASPR